MSEKKFRAKGPCLKISENIAHTKLPVTIKNLPKLIVKPVSFKSDSQEIIGRMKETIHFRRNILNPIDETWDALS